MCGFLGEVSEAQIGETEFKTLLKLSEHRGPDQTGFYKDDACQLGFNRLSILDLSNNANQPLVSPSGNYVMVFNGEIYNYKELQKEFNIPDSQLRSTSDSEIIIHLVEKLSIPDLLSKLNGMFAIAIWDLKNKHLILMRDFAGIKPLFYGLVSNSIVFASQFDQIFQHPKFKNKELRPEIMKEFFGIGYMQSPNTVFKNIYQLNPGQYLIWDYTSKKTIRKEKYFKWSTSFEHLDSDKSSLEKFSHHFSKVVKRQLRADVPIATFLSSGYDSTLVTAFAKRSNPNLRAFTYGVENDKMDETQYAKRYAKILGVDHVVKRNDPKELVKCVDEHFMKMSEPFGDYSSIPTYLITKKARNFAKVMLSGDGGDELFWGYPRFRKSIKLGHWFRYPLWLRKTILPILRRFSIKVSNAIDTEENYGDWILKKQIHFVHLDELMPNIDFSDELKELYCYRGRNTKQNILLYLKKNEFYGHLQRTLKKVDLMSMANSLEVRVPFLDKEIINFSNTVRPTFGIAHDRPKLILKDALYKFIEIENVEKEKRGFTVPLQDWLKNDLKEDFIETILNSPIYGNQFINVDRLYKMVNGFIKDDLRVDHWGLWHVYAWQKWALKYELK